MNGVPRLPRLYRSYLFSDFLISIQADWINEDCRPPESWPDQGVIEFERFDLRYRENLDLALRGIECEIKPGEKVNTYSNKKCVSRLFLLERPIEYFSKHCNCFVPIYQM
jgi:hypothetical protein